VRTLSSTRAGTPARRTRFDRHDEQQVEVGQQVDVPVDGRVPVDGEPGPAAARVQVLAIATGRSAASAWKVTL
jgi:hypothetical protein